jgi:hypothetical protein
VPGRPYSYPRITAHHLPEGATANVRPIHSPSPISPDWAGPLRGLSGAVLVATGSAAYASQASATYLAAESSGLYLDVSQYGGVIQNQVTYSTAEFWSVPEAGSYGRIKNFGYNACVTTDGVPGD